MPKEFAMLGDEDKHVFNRNIHEKGFNDARVSK